MRIMIDINPKLYMAILWGKNVNRKSNTNLLLTLINAIHNGRPVELYEKHGRPVDATKISLKGINFATPKDHHEMINRLVFAPILVKTGKCRFFKKMLAERGDKDADGD